MMRAAGVWLGATLAMLAISCLVAGAGFALLAVMPDALQRTVPLAEAGLLVLVSMVAAVAAGGLLERLMRA